MLKEFQNCGAAVPMAPDPSYPAFRIGYLVEAALLAVRTANNPPREAGAATLEEEAARFGLAVANATEYHTSVGAAESGQWRIALLAATASVVRTAGTTITGPLINDYATAVVLMANNAVAADVVSCYRNDLQAVTCSPVR